VAAGTPVFRICRFRGPLIVLALEPLISRVMRGGGWPPRLSHLQVSRVYGHASPRAADQ
jgi:hypothetical protein